MELILDMSNHNEKIALLNQIRSLCGPHRFEIIRYRPRRSDPQNRYYRGVVVSMIADAIRGHGTDCTDDQVHILLKDKFLKAPLVDRLTGEELGKTEPDSHTLDTAVFGEFVEKCRMWAADIFGIDIPDPDPAYAPRCRGNAAATAL